MIISGVDLGKRLIVAPMAEITDSAFRKISKKYGAGLTFTQMVSAEGIVRGNFETLRYLIFERSEKPIGVQLLGNKPQILSAAVKELQKLKPDLIDLNCGCPVAKVTSNNFGANLLDQPDLLASLISAMYKASNGIPISAKFRLGKEASKINIVTNAKIAEDNGASLIIIHGRLKTDSYNDDVQLNWFEKVKKNVSIPVIGNGSVFEPSDALEMINKYNLDGVMVARGALGNPFLFKRFNKIVESGTDPGLPGIEEVKEVLFEHIQLLLVEYGLIKFLDKAKKHSIWYLREFPGLDILLDGIFAIKNKDELLSFLENHFANIKMGKYPDGNIDEIRKSFNRKVLFWLSNSFTMN